jgi:Ca2+-binding EF-hand superfamily protein
MNELHEIFALVDKDHSGKISREELKTLMETLGLNCSNDEIDFMFREVSNFSKNNSGGIDFEEFVLCVTKKVQVS